MEFKKLKTRLILSVLWMAITFGAVSRIKNLEQIRMVDFLIISAFGASIGVTIVLLGLYFKFRKNKSEQES